MINGLHRSAYEVLGVKQDAEESDIRGVARRLSAKFHPDVCKAADAKTKFQEVQKALDTLLHHRHQHDLALVRKETRHVPDDAVDMETALARVPIRKKKKKRVIVDEFDEFEEPDMGGNLDYESIPDGFDQRDGIFG